MGALARFTCFEIFLNDNALKTISVDNFYDIGFETSTSNNDHNQAATTFNYNSQPPRYSYIIADDCDDIGSNLSDSQPPEYSILIAQNGGNKKSEEV